MRDYNLKLSPAVLARNLVLMLGAVQCIDSISKHLNNGKQEQVEQLYQNLLNLLKSVDVSKDLSSSMSAGLPTTVTEAISSGENDQLLPTLELTKRSLLELSGALFSLHTASNIHQHVDDLRDYLQNTRNPGDTNPAMQYQLTGEQDIMGISSELHNCHKALQLASILPQNTTSEKVSQFNRALTLVVAIEGRLAALSALQVQEELNHSAKLTTSNEEILARLQDEVAQQSADLLRVSGEIQRDAMEQIHTTHKSPSTTLSSGLEAQNVLVSPELGKGPSLSS